MQALEHHAAIGLGANLGDRRAAIARAMEVVARLKGVRVELVSTVHVTRAVTLPGSEDQPDYMNAAATIQTSLDPSALLKSLLAIERDMGRDRSTSERWAPRTIDLDVLFYGGTMIARADLIVPHPRMHERGFVLAPLSEVAPNWVHPRLGRTTRQLLNDLVGDAVSSA